MKNYVILLAGGVGKRMGADIPKQFLMVKGKPIIVHTIERFQENSQIDKNSGSLCERMERLCRGSGERI
mgnify:FL=1